MPWVVATLACLVWMWVQPGEEVVPYHLIWIGFALAYGFEPWPVRRTAVALAVAGLASGWVLVHRVGEDVVAWEELFEAPLMLAISALIVWHVQRREAAVRTVRALARSRLARAAGRERLGRLTSHEIRTPLTIANGYVELLKRDQSGPERSRYLAVLQDELDRLGRAADRLLRMVQLHDHLPRAAIDVDAMLAETLDRWSAVTPRRWVVDSDAGVLHASPERVRACLDTLIENSVRYTEPDDVVRLLGVRHGRHVWIGVADSGPGLSVEQVDAINLDHDAALPPGEGIPPDPRSQTGLGIALVQEIVEARDGRLFAGRSREGGALLLVRLPRGEPTARARDRPAQ